MTTIVAKVFSDRVEILSDGGLTNMVTGAFQLLNKVNKVRSSLFAPLAIVGTGPVHYSERVADTAINWSRQSGGSVDATIGRARKELKYRRDKDEKVLQPSRMLFAGISETKGPRLWEFVNNPGTTPDPWTLVEHVPCIRVIGSEATDAEVDMLDEANTLASMVPMMEAFRARDRRRCNSHVDLTIVRSCGIETRRLHVWSDDVIGQPMWTAEDWLAARTAGQSSEAIAYKYTY